MRDSPYDAVLPREGPRVRFGRNFRRPRATRAHLAELVVAPAPYSAAETQRAGVEVPRRYLSDRSEVVRDVGLAVVVPAPAHRSRRAPGAATATVGGDQHAAVMAAGGYSYSGGVPLGDVYVDHGGGLPVVVIAPARYWPASAWNGAGHKGAQDARQKVERRRTKTCQNADAAQTAPRRRHSGATHPPRRPYTRPPVPTCQGPRAARSTR